MSVSDWQKVYRGVPAHKMQRQPGGQPRFFGGQIIHWTSDPTVAYHFATNPAPGSAATRWSEQQQGEHSGVVLEGWAHKKHILTPGSDEWEDLSDVHNILKPDSYEQEVTLRPGSSVKLTKAHLIGEQFHPNGLQVVDLVGKSRVKNQPLFRSVSIHEPKYE